MTMTMPTTMPDTRIRVLLIDDHPVIVSGIQALIESSEDIACVGTARTAADGLAMANEIRPDVGIVDISLPDGSGLSVAKQILDQGYCSRVVIMTLHDEKAYVQKALQIGVKGFVQKKSASENLLLAIRSVMLGSLFLDPPSSSDMSALSTARPVPENPTGTSSLTEREENVLRMVALGYSNKEIAARIDISIKSVETYKARATGKLRLNSRAQIVRYAINNGWISGDV
jgi:DNA-binding NarL/FixJ family response regulator